MSSSRRITFVLGCHRSGTSTITAGVHALGPTMPGTPIGNGGYGNPKGWAEVREVMDLNEHILHAAGSDWFSLDFDLVNVYKNPKWAELKHRLHQFLSTAAEQHSHALIKDPRIALLHPLWRAEAETLNLQVSIVGAVRHPVSVVRSLQKRDGFPEQFAMAIWVKHVRGLLDANPDIVVDYARLMDLPEFELMRVKDALNLPPPFPPNVEEFCHDFIDQNLQRNAVPPGTQTTSFEVNQLWDELSTRAQT